MLPTEQGKYIAQPRQWRVGTSREGAVELSVEFGLNQWHNDAAGEWQDVSQEGLQIVGYFYPITKTGAVNEMQYESLCESLGWSGNSLKELQDGDWTKIEVQLVLQREEYQGKQQMKVKFINPRDSHRGGMKEADPQMVQSLDQKFGALLRTVAKKKPATTPANGPPLADTEKERRIAYAAVCNKFKPDTDDKKKSIWLEVVAAYFKKPQQHITAAEWKKFIADDFVPPAPENPVSETPVFTEDQIPF